MRDYLAWRLAFGVTTPSTNTVVQPEYDDLRPAGVTNHLARMVIADDPVTSDADFERQLEAIDKSLEDAVARVMDAKPNAFILGISALSVWGGGLGHPDSDRLGRRHRRPPGAWRQEEDRDHGAVLSLHRAAAERGAGCAR